MDAELAVEFMQGQRWPDFHEIGVDAGAEQLTEGVLHVMSAAVPKRTIKEKKKTHPWVNDRVVKLVAAKHAAEGTPQEDVKVAECSAGILEEFGAYAAGVRKELQGLPRGSKQWWRRAG